MLQRFLPVGQSRFQVLTGITHVPEHGQRVAAALEQLKPELVLVDRSRAEWRHRRRLDELDKMLWPHLGSGLKAGALWEAVHGYCQGSGARLGLLHDDVDAPPTGRDGLRGLKRLLKREGFESTTPKDNLQRLYGQYIPRCPALWEWVESRRDRTAARLCAGYARQAQRAVVIVPAPHADEVCERVRAMLS